jgi:hypothetical protein
LISSKEKSRWRATSLPVRSSRYLLDNTVFIAAVKRGWTESTELIYHLLDSSAELYADAVLITNDNPFNIWSNTKAIKRLLDVIEDFEDAK